MPLGYTFMMTTLNKLVHQEIEFKRGRSRRMASLGSYFDLEKSELTLELAADRGAGPKDKGAAEEIAPFFRGRTVEVVINLQPKDSIPAEASLYLFSSYLDLTDPPHKSVPTTKKWIETSYSFFHTLYQRIFHSDRSAAPKQYRSYLPELQEIRDISATGSNRLNNLAQEELDLPSTTSELDVKFAAFPLDALEDKITLRFNLASGQMPSDPAQSTDLILILNSGEKWSAALPVSLPWPFFEAMISMSARPYRIDIESAQELYLNPVLIEFERSDGQPVHLKYDLASGTPFHVENVREDCVRLKVKDEGRHTSTFQEEIYYLQFFDRSSSDLLSCCVPVIVDGKKDHSE